MGYLYVSQIIYLLHPVDLLSHTNLKTQKADSAQESSNLDLCSSESALQCGHAELAQSRTPPQGDRHLVWAHPPAVGVQRSRYASTRSLP